MCEDASSSLLLKYTTSLEPCQTPLDPEATDNTPGGGDDQTCARGAATPLARGTKQALAGQEVAADGSEASADEAPVRVAGFPVASRIFEFGKLPKAEEASTEEQEAPAAEAVATSSVTLMHNQACVVSQASLCLARVLC